MNKIYHLIAINDRSGRKTTLTRTPVTHKEAMIIKSKQSDATKKINRLAVVEYKGIK
jgi:hypothetical protein